MFSSLSHKQEMLFPQIDHMLKNVVDKAVHDYGKACGTCQSLSLFRISVYGLIQIREGLLPG